ncbi:E3 ubiquitin-protein ligase XIAP X8 [Biomphalaria glabrata]|nr:E3 ubiquitin-protein ligase XIAP X8 [Biomphalaria glabrata]
MTSRRKSKDIVIKPADKGGSIVVWDRNLYIKEALNQLSDTNFYAPRKTDGTISNNKKVKVEIDKIIADNLLPRSAHKLRLHDSELGKPYFYLLPKIHKLNNPGRPIVSACSCPTELISRFLDTIFQPIVEKLPTFIKDTNHALLTLAKVILQPDKEYLLFLLDVSSLYTSIPHADGLKAIRYFFDIPENKHKSISTDILVRLTELVLNLNSFEFNGQFFDQISGVAMGTAFGPSYACLFMGFLELNICSSYTGPMPEFYRRYIDDGLGITSLTENELIKFIEFTNNFNPAIRFTYTISRTRVNFLDIEINVTQNSLFTSCHYKDTDSHSYLLYSSSHPPSCKDSIPYSQLLRIRRLCQDDNNFTEKATEMIEFFLRRGYPQAILDKALSRVENLKREQAFKKKTISSNDERPKLILTYHPHNVKAKNIFLKNLNILQADEHTRDVFSSPPLVVFRRDQNLQDILVHTKLHNISSEPGTWPCKRRNCQTCKHTLATPTVTCPKMTIKISGKFNCNSRGVIYAIICSRCQMVYIGNTGRTLKTRLQEHLRDIRNFATKPVSIHFNNPHHRGTTDLLVTAIQQCNDKNTRLQIENKLIYMSGTLQPNGINNQHTFV